MGAITFSGANGIDFNVILNAVMAQERVPLDNLEAQRKSLETKSSAFSTLATRLGTLGTAAEALTKASAFGGRTVSSTDGSIVGASGTTDAVPGIYDLKVQELARAQVTGTSSRHADSDSTVVATGGSIRVGDTTVTLSGSVTLQQLASQINGTEGVDVIATVVKTSAGYQMVMTGRETGVANAFTVTNNLTGSTVQFTDTDADGVSGDTAADNAMSALDAKVLINNVEVTSTTNTLEEAIPGTTLNLLRKMPDETVTISVSDDSEATADLVDEFVDAYNALMDYADQQSALGTGITNDPLFRSLKSQLRTVISSNYSAGDSITSLGQAGVEFERTGRLSVDADRLEDALENSTDLRNLFMGTSTQPGVFQQMQDTIAQYTDAGGLLASLQDRLDDQIDAMDDRLAAMEERLENRRLALQKEYIAADNLISQLNNQAGTLSSLGS